MSSNTVIATNIIALNAHRNLGNTANKNYRQINRISSGIKINTASEDAAGVTISQKLKAQIRGLNMAEKNSEDAISLVETLDLVYSEIGDMFQRCREITVQALNDTNSTEDRVKLMSEVSELIDEVEDMLNKTEFNTKNINEIMNSSTVFQVGANSSQYLKFSQISNLDLSIRDYTTQQQVLDVFIDTVFPNIEKLASIEISGRDTGKVGTTIKFVSTEDNSETTFHIANVSMYIDAINEAIDSINTYLYDDLSSIKNILKNSISEAVESSIEDTLNFWQVRYDKFSNVSYDITIDVISRGEEAVLETKYGADLEEINDFLNNVNGMVIVRKNAVDNILSPQLTEAVESFLSEYTKLGEDIFVASIKDHVNAFIDGKVEDERYALDLYLNAFDDFINQVSDIRAELGAIQNRLEYTINNLQIASENMSSANSKLEDADVASEMMGLTKSNVLSNAAISILAQSNSSKESILNLLS